MVRYHKQTRILVAIDCIIFGFDGANLKLLLVQRGLEYEKGKWSLMGGFIQKDEDFENLILPLRDGVNFLRRK